MPTGTGMLRNLGSDNSPERSLAEASRWYDQVYAVPVQGLTHQQATRFIQEMQIRTGPGTTFSFNEFPIGRQGETCASVIAESLRAAGAPNPINSNSDFNLVRPSQIVNTVERLNEQARNAIN